MAKCKIPVILIVVIILAGVDCSPRKKLVKNVSGNRRSQLLSSTILSDYWKERGFHDSLTDHLIASESQGKDLLLTGDELEDFKGDTQVRIPRGRLTPPGKLPEVVSFTASVSIPRKHKLPYAKRRQDRVRNRRPLIKAQRKQDMEILESVTLVDGGVPTDMGDGSIQIIEQSPHRPQRKYHQEPASSNDQVGSGSYLLQMQNNAPYSNQQQQQQRQQPVAQPSIQASYHAMPPASYYDQYQGKPQASYKGPKSLSQLTMEQFQQEVYNTHQNQPHQPYGTLPPSTAAPKVVPLFLVPKQQNYQHPLSPPVPLPQQQYQPPPPPPPSQPSPQPQYQHQPAHPPPPQPQSQYQHPTPPQPQQQQHPSQPQPQPHYPPPQQEMPFNAQLFNQQFQHPFGSQSNGPSPLAQLTATILSTASGAASAAAKVLANGELSSLQLPQPSTQAEARHPLLNPVHPPTNLPQLASHMLSAAASIQSEVLLPTTTPLPLNLPMRPGVVQDDEQAVIQQNQLIEPENLANQLTRIYETGKKILYFPKGVVDTVDTFLKQMERNPMVAYWGDKFFAKVFGDTSGT